MFTECPNCESVFRVTPETLRSARGEVRCGNCRTKFDALASLTDSIAGVEDGDERPAAPRSFDDTATQDDPSDDSLARAVADLTGARSAPEDDDAAWAALAEEPEAILWLSSEDDEPKPEPSFTDPDTGSPGDADEDDGDDDPDAPIPEEIPEEESGYEDEIGDDSEPDVHTESVPAIGDTDADLRDGEPDDETAVDAGPEIESDVDVGSIDEPEQSTEAASEPIEPQSDDDWFYSPLTDKSVTEEADEFAKLSATGPGSFLAGRSGLAAASAGIVLLAVVLVGQLVHYNRDELAASPSYGDTIAGIYDALGITLFPAWRLDNYEVRAAEAVAGQTGEGALEIRAQIAITGQSPTGLPLIRVVLRDRWSKPMGSRLFKSEEYLPGDARFSRVVEPGSLLPVKISVVDPGVDAQGFEVDVCLPDRYAVVRCKLGAIDRS